ncbi:WD40 repeat domain-containing protein [Streptomyces mirabilis]|uniref:WD40 repeat domain-containing protein n=1 Tax=Streptomyces mirabilis TaxID=68239 RepID=UPI003696A996
MTLTEEGAATALAISPDGARLAAGDSSGRVAIWSGRAERRLGRSATSRPLAVR